MARKRPPRTRPSLWGIVAAALTTVWVSVLLSTSELLPSPPDPRDTTAESDRGGGVADAQAGRPAANTRITKPVDWVALNPEFDGATFVNDRATCLGCHEDSIRTYDHTLHAAALDFAAGASSGGGCESCHGPRSKHVEEPSDALSFATLAPAAQSGVCVQCHQAGSQIGFKAGPHHSAEVSCTSCHVVMDKKSARGLLTKASATQVCVQCHSEVRTEILKASHHPIREGRMECSSCHNPHASTEALLVKNTVNDTCVTCHAGKRGPFLWEHAPVRESCSTCHTPHGSNQRFLLTQRDPFLCLTCHSYGGHINLPRYNRTSNPYGNGCTNCHVMTHGSNHPSGAKLTR